MADLDVPDISRVRSGGVLRSALDLAAAGMAVFPLPNLPAHGVGSPVATWTVNTAGGQQLYFSVVAPAELPATGDVLSPEVSNRADRGYAVGPGSWEPTGRYTIINDTPPLPLPSWIDTRLRGRARPPSPSSPPHWSCRSLQPPPVAAERTSTPPQRGVAPVTRWPNAEADDTETDTARDTGPGAYQGPAPTHVWEISR